MIENSISEWKIEIMLGLSCSGGWQLRLHCCWYFEMPIIPWYFLIKYWACIALHSSPAPAQLQPRVKCPKYLLSKKKKESIKIVWKAIVWSVSLISQQLIGPCKNCLKAIDKVRAKIVLSVRVNKKNRFEWSNVIKTLLMQELPCL